MVVVELVARASVSVSRSIGQLNIVGHDQNIDTAAADTESYHSTVMSRHQSE